MAITALPCLLTWLSATLFPNIREGPREPSRLTSWSGIPCVVMGFADRGALCRADAVRTFQAAGASGWLGGRYQPAAEQIWRKALRPIGPPSLSRTPRLAWPCGRRHACATGFSHGAADAVRQLVQSGSNPSLNPRSWEHTNACGFDFPKR